LAAYRLMSLSLYEQRVADLRASVDADRQALAEDRNRLLDIERQWVAATEERDEAAARAGWADEQLGSALTNVAALERELRETVAELEAVKRGSFTERSLDARFERLAAIVAENTGPEPSGTKPRRKPAAVEAA